MSKIEKREYVNINKINLVISKQYCVNIIKNFK